MTGVYKAIFFDFDGVLADSFPAVHEVYRYLGRELDFHVPGVLEEFREAYIAGYHHFFHKAGLDAARKEQAKELFHREIVKKTIPAFPGVERVLRILQQRYSLFLVSANYQSNVERQLESFGLRRYFLRVIGQPEGGRDIDKAVVFRQLMDEYSLAADAVVAVGDRISDFQDALRAGIQQVVVTDYGWGYDPGKLPSHVPRVKSPAELITVLSHF